MTTDPTTPGYSHTQPAPLCLLLYATAAILLVVGLAVPDVPPIRWLFPPIGLLTLAVAASFHHLTAEDPGDVLAIRFGTLPLFYRTVRDTQGVPGSPNIVATIFEKIGRADVFVADVSFITPPDYGGRPTPNPNVLIELGYAATPSDSNRRFHRLMVLNEQSNTALMVAHGWPASSNRRMWARSRASGTAARR